MPYAILQSTKGKGGGVYTPEDKEFSTIMRNLVTWKSDASIAVDDSKFRQVGKYGMLYVEPTSGESNYFIVEENGQARMIPTGHPDFDFFIKIFYENPMAYELGLMTPDSRSSWSALDWLKYERHQRQIEDELNRIYQPQTGRQPQPMNTEKETYVGRLPYATDTHDTHVSDELDSIYTSVSKRKKHAEG